MPEFERPEEPPYLVERRDLRSYRPLAWVFLACLAFWALMYALWPRVTLYVLAGTLGVLTSIAAGAAIRRRLERLFPGRRDDTTSP